MEYTSTQTDLDWGNDLIARMMENDNAMKLSVTELHRLETVASQCRLPPALIVDLEMRIRTLYQDKSEDGTQISRDDLARFTMCAAYGLIYDNDFGRYGCVQVPNEPLWTPLLWKSLIHMARPHDMRNAVVQYLDGIDMNIVRHLTWTDTDVPNSYSGILFMTVWTTCKSGKVFFGYGLVPIDTCTDEFRMSGLVMDTASTYEKYINTDERVVEFIVASTLLNPQQIIDTPLFARGMYCMAAMINENKIN